MADAVTCAIPGAKRPPQVDENVAAADLPPIPGATMKALQGVYEPRIRELVHQRW
jgi:aryl-alcohol dehydrogenase-like predicted oxidoreductase